MMRVSLFGHPLRLLNFLFLLAPHHRPTLELGDGATLFDPHQVADRVCVGLVVRVVFFRSSNRFFHRRVRKTTINAHDNCLVLLVAHNYALERTLRHLEPLISSTSSWRATSVSQRPSVWQSWSSSRAPVRPQLWARAPAFRHAFAPRWFSCARCRVGSPGPVKYSRADPLPAGSAG